MNEIELPGCEDETLINYLKGLGIFRIIHQQADPSVRGYWRRGHFCIRTKLAPEELERFFQEDFSPSPFFVPWGSRSGFWDENSEKGAREALEKIMGSENKRFQKFIDGVLSIRKINQKYSINKKPDKKEKDNYIFHLRSEVNNSVRQWIDACYALTENGSEVMYLLGTGGNEGSGSYSKSHMEALNFLFFNYEEDQLNRSLKASLYGDRYKKEKDLSCGQLNPETAQNNLLNPWDIVLALEGALFFAGSATKKYNVSGEASFPFTVEASLTGVGHLSDIKTSEFSKEFWMPVWDTPSRFQEIVFLFKEGKVNFGKKKVRNGLDFNLAVSSLGVDRGISAFNRYGRMERNGQSNIAIFMGKFKVQNVKNTDLIAECDYWINKLRILSNNSNTPVRYKKHFHRIESAIFDFTKYGGEGYLQNVLIELGKAEQSFSKASSEKPVKPLSGLTAKWIPACDDGSAEYRIACALASINDSDLGSIRKQLEPVKWRGSYEWIEDLKSVTWSQSDLYKNLINILKRRVLESQKLGKGWPVRGYYKADIHDIVLFINGELDEDKISSLLFGLSTIKWRDYKEPARVENQETFSPYFNAYALLKLVFPDGVFTKKKGILKTTYKTDVDNGTVSIKFDEDIINLFSHNPQKAIEIAIRRLRTHGFVPMGSMKTNVLIPDFALDQKVSERILAALLIPVWQYNTLAKAVLRNTENKSLIENNIQQEVIV